MFVAVIVVPISLALSLSVPLALLGAVSLRWRRLCLPRVWSAQ